MAKIYCFFDNYCRTELTDKDGQLLSLYCDGQTHYNETTTIPLIDKEIELFCSHYKI